MKNKTWEILERGKPKCRFAGYESNERQEVKTSGEW